MGHIPDGSFPFAEMSRLSITACLSLTCRFRISRNGKFVFRIVPDRNNCSTLFPGGVFWCRPPLHFCIWRRSVEKPLRVRRAFPRHPSESGKEWTAFFYKDTDREANGSSCVHRGHSVKKNGRKTVFVTFFKASLWECLAVRRARSFPKEPVHAGKGKLQPQRRSIFPSRSELRLKRIGQKRTSRKGGLILFRIFPGLGKSVRETAFSLETLRKVVPTQTFAHSDPASARHFA